MAIAPRARRRLRHRDRLRARRHDPRPARPRLRRCRRLYPHQRIGRAAQHRAVHVGALPHPEHPYRCRARCSPTRRRPAPIAGRAASRPISSASGCSIWRRRISASTASSSGAAISSPQEEMPYPLATDFAVRAARDRIRQRQLSRHARPLPAGVRLGEKAQLQGKLIDGRYHGIALGCFIEGGAAGPKENARIVLEPDGSASVYVGSSAIGQGLETMFSQIAADALEMPLDRMRVLARLDHLSAARATAPITRARSVMGGSAMLAAAKSCSQKSATRRRSGSAARRPTRDRGRAGVGPRGRSLTLAELAAEGNLAPKAASPTTTTPIPTARTPPMSRSIPHRPCARSSTMSRRGCRAHHQPADAEGTGRSARWCRVRRRVPRASRLRRQRPAADRLVRRLPDAERERLPDIRCFRWKTNPRRSTRSAPRARARAASSRSAA